MKMLQKTFESIEKTKRCFEESFKSGTYYDKQTQDETHLMLILNAIKVTGGMNILDLGTGTGYLAFPLARKYPDAQVTGLDIVEEALDKNRECAESEGLKNLGFVNTFSEISRVLKPGGIFFLTDPAPNDNDTEGFVDAYMQMKKDGHIKFYTKQEWQEIGKEAGLSLADDFETSIRFPKKIETALEFNEIMSRFAEEVTDGYLLEIMDNEIWISPPPAQAFPCRPSLPRIILYIFTLFPNIIFSFTKTTRPYPSSTRLINSSRSSAISTLLFL